MNRALRLLAAAIIGAAILVLVPAQPAHALCEGDPPMPAAPGPYRPRVVADDNPFDGGASIQSVYGTTPHLWNYDNGCTPGSGIMPGVGAGLANVAFDVSGALAAWTQALLEAVVSPTWAEPLDKPVADATSAVAEGTWTPWLVLVLTLVAIVVLFRARDGHLSGAITATIWALLVLIAVSWVVSYPTESVRAVDGSVQTAVVDIGSGFSDDTSDGKVQSPFSGEDTTEERALSTVDQQIGSVVYTVQYRMWLKAVFGDPDSPTAQKYGPAVFRATHFSWAEWERYTKDPEGEGTQLREQKQEEFKSLASDIKEADPVAYRHFTGGQWGNRLSSGALSVVVMSIICVFLLVAGLMILAAFAVIRLLVPFTPALGVIFLLDVARERAIDVFRRVGGVLVMGPAYFVASLVLLRFYGELLTADLPFLLRLAFVIALSFIAWRLLRPASTFVRVCVPGQRALQKHLSIRRTTSSRAETGGETSPQAPRAATTGTRQRPVFSSDGLAQPPPPAAANTPGTFVEREQPDVVVKDDAGRPGTVVATHSRTTASSGDNHGRPGYTGPAVPDVILVAQGSRDRDGGPAGVVDQPTKPPERGEAAAGVPTMGPRVPRRGSESINEANLTFDEEGRRVFVVYTPDKAAG